MKKKSSLYTKLLMLSYELEGNVVLESIKRGFLMLVPVLFLGALALVLKSFPIPGFQVWLQQAWNGGFLKFLDSIYEATYGFISIYIVIGIAYNLGKKLFPKSVYEQSLIVILSVICLTESLGLSGENFSYQAFGNTGTFTAIIIAIVVPYLYFIIQRLVSKLLARIRKAEQVSDHHTLALLCSFVFCAILFFSLNKVLFTITGYDSLNDMFAAFLSFAFQSLKNDLSSGLLFTLSSSLLWFCGIHGGNALELVADNVFTPMDTNPEVIMSKSFLDVFGLMGGCGTSICLITALLLFSRKKEYVNLGKMAVPTVLFNVNETIVFGLPIIFNPILLIPFVLTPMMCVTIAYLAAFFGLMPIPCIAVEWTTPILLSGYVATGSIAGLVVQLISFICGVALYTPFIRLMEKVERERENFLVNELEQLYKTASREGIDLNLEGQRQAIRQIYTMLKTKLHKDIEQHNVEMFYQPQLDCNQKIMGVEALLRWEFNGKRIFPPLVIALAKKEGLINELSMEVLRQSCIQGKNLLSQNPEFKISVNMVAEQLNEPDFVEQLLRMISEYHMEINICLEITEETNMDNLVSIKDNIRTLKKAGIRFAMDDFSMGYTSLKYLQESLFDYVKLDGVLVQEAMQNKRSEEIIASIIQLGRKLQFQIIAEYVDTKEKEAKLIEIGCDYLQGYLYSPAVPMDSIVEMMNAK